jgi:hypothetical protein
MNLSSMRVERLATFLTSSLLISHNIRRDTIAIIKLRSDLWICASGSRVRQLRPDEDSAIGWINAVAKSKRREFLGAIKVFGTPRIIGGEEIYVVCEAPLHSSFPLKDKFREPFPKIFKYIKYSDFYSKVKKETDVLFVKVRCELAPIIINIALDRIEEGKKDLVFDYN